MPRRRLPRLDPCKVNLRRLAKVSEDGLMKVWVRLGASAPSRTNVNSLLKGIVSNRAAAKLSARIYKDDPAQRRRAVRTYLFIARRLETDFRRLQAASCGIGPRGGVRLRHG